jgi:hypothetical protein
VSGSRRTPWLALVLPLGPIGSPSNLRASISSLITGGLVSNTPDVTNAINDSTR